MDETGIRVTAVMELGPGPKVWDFYHGPLTIEREIAHDPERQKTDIGHAVRLLESLRAKILG